VVRSCCRHHHHLKQHPHWTAHTRPDGRIDWRHRHERRGPRPTPWPGPARPDHPADRSRAAIAASHNPSGIPTGAESSTSSGMSRNEARYSSAHIHGGPVPGPSKAPPTRLPSRGRSSGTAQASLTRSSSRISHPPVPPNLCSKSTARCCCAIGLAKGSTSGSQLSVAERCSQPTVGFLTAAGRGVGSAG